MPALPLEPEDPRELGRFRLVGRLGEGGQGVVYLGEDAEGRPAAIKVLKTGADEKARERLAREMAAAQKVAPFCTARVIEASVRGSRPYVVSEYVNGPSLLERVRATGPLRDGELDRLVVGTATALTAIHGAGIIHRDLKPANVLLGPDGPRVVDFGIARAIDAGTMTGLVGTPAYFAPEQLAEQPPTPALDVFSWAATMVFAATGRAPFGQDTIPAILNRIAHHEPDLSGVPADLAGVLSGCLDKDPARRPTARALLVRLVDPSAGVERHVGGPLAAVADQALQAPTGSATRGDAYPYAPPGAPGPGVPAAFQQGRPGGYAATQSDGGRAGSSAATVPAPPEAKRGRTGLVMAAVGGGLVLALTAGGAIWLASGSGKSPATGRSSSGTSAGTSAGSGSGKASTGSSASSPAPSTSASAGGGPVIPADLAGTWTGKVVQTNNLLGDTLSSNVKITLAAGVRTAPARYADWGGCTETYTLTAIAGSVYTFGTATSDDPFNCSTIGVVTLTKVGSTLKYHWGTGPSGEISNAVLTKTTP